MTAQEKEKRRSDKTLVTGMTAGLYSSRGYHKLDSDTGRMSLIKRIFYQDGLYSPNYGAVSVATDRNHINPAFDGLYIFNDASRELRRKQTVTCGKGQHGNIFVPLSYLNTLTT